MFPDNDNPVLLKIRNLFHNIKNFVIAHKILFVFSFIGIFGGIPGVLIGILSGVAFDFILKSFIRERKLRNILEHGRCVESVPGEPFPSAFYFCALMVFCLEDFETAYMQIKSVLGKKYRGDWSLFCRAASSVSCLNDDLIVECIASVVRKTWAEHNKEKIPLYDYFYLLQTAESAWDEKKRGRKPSLYLAELLDYRYMSEDLVNAYKILGVSPDDDKERIKAAHRKLAARFHPDHADNKQQHEFLKIQEAYELILHQLS